MTIPVTCPSCLTRFSVSDKFAGKSGPCPKCKAVIKIPDLSEQVVIHAPVDTALKDSKGRSIFKPIRREEVKLGWPVLLSASVGSLVVVCIALAFRLSHLQPPVVLLGLAALLLAVPLVLTGYWFLRDDELQGYTGRELWIRCGICSAVFAFSWGLYSWVPAYVSGNSSVAETSAVGMAVMIAAMIAVGTAVAVLALELELGQGLLLYMLYLVITFLLVWISGAPLSEFLPGTAAPTPAFQQPAGETPSDARDGKVTDSSATGESPIKSPPAESLDSEPPKKDIPKLLQ